MRIRYDPKLKQTKMLGYQFARQKPIDHYIVDFYCPKLRLVGEIDGDSHRSKFQQDVEPQRRLESAGVQVLEIS